jgi:hypothetical protein
VRLLALPVQIEVEDRVGPDREVGHVHEALQGVVQLARAVELPGTPALPGHLPQGLGRARGGRGSAGGLVVQLVDAVPEAGELGEGRAEPPLLPGEGSVHGEGEREVAEGGGEGGLAVEGRRAARRQRWQERAHRVGDGQERGLPGHPEHHRQALRHRERRDQQGHERPHREAAHPDHLPQGVDREHEEGVERERLRQLPPAEAGEEGGGRDAQAEEQRVGDLEPPRGPGRERTDEGDSRQHPGHAEEHLPRAPPHADVEDGVFRGGGFGHEGGQRLPA